MLASIVLVYNKISIPLLNLFIALLILLLGFAIASFLKYVIILALRAIQFDNLLKQVKFNAILEKAEIKRSPAELLGDFVFWFTIFLIILSLAAQINIPVESALDKIISFTGIILLAALILSIGTYLAVFISGLVYLVAANLGLPGAKNISRIIQYFTVIFAFLLALEHLGVGPALLIPSIGVGLAIAIAFGLGCKDIMADFVSNLIRGR
jgi:hypothetical protein